MLALAIAAALPVIARAQGADQGKTPAVIEAALGRSIAVPVAQAGKLLKDPADLGKLSLYLNGHKIAGAKASSMTLDGETGRILFDLPAKLADQSLMAAVWRGDLMSLSIGLEGGQPIDTKSNLRLTEPPQVVSASMPRQTARIEHPIQIHVYGLQRWLETQKAADPNTGDEAHIRLFLAGHELIGVRPSVTPLADGTSELTFDATNRTVPEDRKEENRAAWVNIVSLIRSKGSGGELPVTIGIEKSSRLMQSGQSVTFELYSSGTYVALALVPLLAFALLYLGRKSDLVREIELDDVPAGARSCYSLARCQMAVWFFLVIAAYIYITFTFGVPPAITSTILSLIGISAGTGLAAAVIDNSQRNERIKQSQTLRSRLDSLTSRVADLKQLLTTPPGQQTAAGGAAAAPAPDPAANAELQQELRDKTAEVADVQARIANLPPLPPPRTSSGFILDLLRDQGSVSFHRFQIAVWTLVLAVIFIRSVWHDLAMPEFDNTLLALMGISSGTYLGFKIPEKPLPTPEAGK